MSHLVTDDVVTRDIVTIDGDDLDCKERPLQWRVLRDTPQAVRLRTIQRRLIQVMAESLQCDATRLVAMARAAQLSNPQKETS